MKSYILDPGNTLARLTPRERLDALHSMAHDLFPDELPHGEYIGMLALTLIAVHFRSRLEGEDSAHADAIMDHPIIGPAEAVQREAEAIFGTGKDGFFDHDGLIDPMADTEQSAAAVEAPEPDPMSADLPADAITQLRHTKTGKA